MKNLFQSSVITGMVAAVAAISIPSGYANEGTAPGWRKGFSSWNGSSYDLPKQVSNPWETFESTKVDSKTGAIDRGSAEAEYKPYTVPEGPQSNPYVKSRSGESSTQPTQADPGSAKLAAPSDDFSELFSTLVRPDQDGQAGKPAATGKDASPTRLSPPDNTAENVADDAVEDVAENPANSAKLSAPTNTPNVSASAAAKDAEPAATPQKEAVEKPANPESVKPANTQVSSGADKLAAGSIEDPPLQKEIIRWYQYPRSWMKGWDSHAEFGIDGSDGNADTLAIQTGVELKRQSDLHTFKIDIDYRQANSRNTTTENNGRLNTDYDRMIADSRWSGFGKLGLEWDRFKPFDLRINLNGGAGYFWIREDDASLVTRFGAGASREIGAPDDDWIPEALFGFDAERQVNARNKLKGKLDYFPSWESFGDYRLVADIAWEILLDDSENLSLKLAATDRYDSTPQGAKPNDVYYSLLLLYKF